MNKFPQPSATRAVVEFETIDSTNAEAHRRAAAGESGPLWLRAERQEHGRGRSGRGWASPAGNLSATLLFQPKGVNATAYHHISFISGVAAWDALRAFGVDAEVLQLKWPNDLMFADAKLGGILVESSRYLGQDVIIVGIGINLAAAPAITGRDVTHLAAHGYDIAPAALLKELAPAMDRWLGVWARGANFGAIVEAWSGRAHPPGRAITVNARDGLVEGTFEGLGADGRLELRTGDGARLSVTHGDVSLVRHGTGGTSR